MLKGMVNNPASFLKDMKNFAASTQPSLSNLPRHRSAAHKAHKSVTSRNKRTLNYASAITSPRDAAEFGGST